MRATKNHQTTGSATITQITPDLAAAAKRIKQNIRASERENQTHKVFHSTHLSPVARFFVILAGMTTIFFSFAAAYITPTWLAMLPILLASVAIYIALTTNKTPKAPSEPTTEPATGLFHGPTIRFALTIAAAQALPFTCVSWYFKPSWYATLPILLACAALYAARTIGRAPKAPPKREPDPLQDIEWSRH